MGLMEKVLSTLLAAVLLSTGVSISYAENTSLAMAEPLLLKGSVQINVNAGDSQTRFQDTRQQLLIDGETRVIGGAVDRSDSQQKQLPAQKFPFFIDSKTAQRREVTLRIGSIHGLNTPEAHTAGQSQATFVSSPAVIKLNGVRVGYVYTDGNAIQVRVPQSVLKRDGFNVLQIEAGFYFLPGNRIAYDELELQQVALLF
jgi:hypothetical protein